MGKLVITVDLDNEAMENPDDAMRAIKRAIAWMEDGKWPSGAVSVGIFDVNGNRVGTLSYEG